MKYLDQDVEASRSIDNHCRCLLQNCSSVVSQLILAMECFHKARPHAYDAMKYSNYLRFYASRNIADHLRLLQVPFAKSQQFGQLATHSGMISEFLSPYSTENRVRVGYPKKTHKQRKPDPCVSNAKYIPMARVGLQGLVFSPQGLALSPQGLVLSPQGLALAFWKSRVEGITQCEGFALQ